MPNVLVTGGAGFIGSHVCERLLNEGYGVTCLDNFDPFYDPAVKRRNLESSLRARAFTLIEGDITDGPVLESVFERGSFDLVIHLAAKAGVRPSIQFPLEYQRVNVQGTAQVFEACRAFGVKKMILASSSSVYGNNTKVPYAETDNVDRAISPYAATKKACEVMAHAYYHLYGIETFCLRFFTVYGPRQRPEMAIHAFAKAVSEGRPVSLYGDGSTLRDYTYIDDIVDGIVGCIRHLKGYEILNLGESRTIALIDLLQLIEKAVGKKATISWQPEQPGDVRMTWADIRKAKRLIGYRPRVDLELGIWNFIAWFTAG
jgi:UDP-glucuronate 4-epimerase